ncbi:MAG: M15 family metallopeptidase [Clostridia bacterium]|nr:M15 family metallopeptidase [Clostridia bacterium]
MKKQSKQRRRNRRKGLLAFVIVLLLVVWGGVKLPLVFTESVEEAAFGSTALYRSKTVDNALMRTGDLILVNGGYAYDFEQAETKYPIASLKNDSYQVKNDEISLNKKTIKQFNALFRAFERHTGHNNVSIISAYRDYAYQESVLNDYISSYGYDTAMDYVAMPGFSEHHTGLAADIAVADEAGETETFTGEDEYAFVGENAWKYGFINRYPADKTGVTGIANEPWHYRYVGKAHAYVMREKGMCLEEYEEYLRNFTFGQSCLSVNIHGDDYKIYYIPAGEGSTRLQVPLFGRYTVSGNNMDGFIVTV